MANDVKQYKINSFIFIYICVGDYNEYQYTSIANAKKNV